MPLFDASTRSCKRLEFTVGMNCYPVEILWYCCSIRVVVAAARGDDGVVVVVATAVIVVALL